MRILREPLLHFLMLGVLVYAAARVVDGGESGRYRIDAGPEQRARIAKTYLQQYGVAPTESQLTYLLDQYVRSEILFREGLALGLDRDDEIVRRRVVQKIEFLNEDTDAIDVSDSELERFFAAHQSRYLTPAAVSLTLVYFSADPKGEGDAHRRAQAALAKLRDGARAEAGDPFETGNEIAALNELGAQRLFGDSQLSAALFSAPAAQWVGPFRSAFGWHVIRIEQRQSAQAAALDRVKDRVRADYLTAERERRNESEFKRLASKYHVVTDGSPT
jgi:peptidyl-prolyl cis-trans isomerase C